jgi:hypothetical protein
VVFPTTNCVNLNFTFGIREMTIMFSRKKKCGADLCCGSVNDWCPIYPSLISIDIVILFTRLPNVYELLVMLQWPSLQGSAPFASTLISSLIIIIAVTKHLIV